MQLFWEHFGDWLAQHHGETLRQLTPSRVAEYGDLVQAGGDSPKYIKNRFTSLRGVLNFAKKRGMHAGDMRHALDYCAVLTAPRLARKHAPSPWMRALLLGMLNLCMYPGETLNLSWGEINLAKRTVVTDRAKTGVIRVGVLWDCTAEALAAIRPPQMKPEKVKPETPVFLSGQGTR